MTQPIDEFISRVERLYEVEYGDFRRKVSQYMMRLEQSLSGQKASAEIKKIISEMRRDVVYQPKPDIELARLKTLEAAKKIKQLAH